MGFVTTLTGGKLPPLPTKQDLRPPKPPRPPTKKTAKRPAKALPKNRPPLKTAIPPTIQNVPPPPKVAEGDHSWREPFLDLLRAYPHVTRAADMVGVDRRRAYRERSADPDFASAWDQAWKQGITAAEHIGLEMGLNGNATMMIFMLKGLKPDVYGDHQRISAPGGGPVAVAATHNLKGLDTDTLQTILLIAEALKPKPE